MGDVADDVADRSAQVSDGRTVAWTEYGPVDGTPLLRVPGTPGSRWSIRSDRTPWAERGLRVLTTERQGYGASTRQPGRRIAEHSDDLAQILDLNGIDRAWVTGGSGAAPHILSFAARHPDRVRAITVLAGAAPLNDEQVGQMIELNQRSNKLCQARDVEGLTELLGPYREGVLADPLGGFRGLMKEAPAEDQAVMNDPGWQAVFSRAIREALGQGLEGWLDECFAITNEWGEIELADVTASVTWWHSAEDRNAPLEAAQTLVARLPHARLNVWPDGGHFAAYHREGQILDELLARG
jgi:pimeloyl-ACP methyl ester carboxylesterase